MHDSVIVLCTFWCQLGAGILSQVLISVGVNLGQNTVVLATIMTHTIRNECIIAYFNLEVMNRLGIFLLEVYDI